MTIFVCDLDTPAAPSLPRARDSVVVFIFQETEPLTGFELQLSDPRFQLKVESGGGTRK